MSHAYIYILIYTHIITQLYILVNFNWIFKFVYELDKVKHKSMYHKSM